MPSSPTPPLASSGRPSPSIQCVCLDDAACMPQAVAARCRRCRRMHRRPHRPPHPNLLPRRPNHSLLLCATGSPKTHGAASVQLHRASFVNQRVSFGNRAERAGRGEFIDAQLNMQPRRRCMQSAEPLLLLPRPRGREDAAAGAARFQVDEHGAQLLNGAAAPEPVLPRPATLGPERLHAVLRKRGFQLKETTLELESYGFDALVKGGAFLFNKINPERRAKGRRGGVCYKAGRSYPTATLFAFTSTRTWSDPPMWKGSTIQLGVIRVPLLYTIRELFMLGAKRGREASLLTPN
eukprot:5777346-Pleurochrysis_carterae.AAC.5